MSTRLTGHLITCTEIKVQLVAEDVAFAVTLSRDGGGHLWRYNISLLEASEHKRNSRLAFGRVVAPDPHGAMRRIGEIASQGYEPGTIERGLFETLAAAADEPGAIS